MNQDIQTIELAKTYEDQGHYKDAYEIYLALDREQSTKETQDGLNRTQSMFENDKKGNQAEKRISALLEKWLKLMVLKQRLRNFERIKARLV